MKKYNVVIIGAGPAGIVTGMTVKKQYPEKTVLILAEEEKGLIPCGIPYIFNKLSSVEQDLMGIKPFENIGGVFEADPVESVDTDTKQVTCKSGQIYVYDKLVFATGSKPVEASFIPGYELENTFYIKKSYSYIANLYEQLADKRNIVVIGGGFIGAEVAEQLAANHRRKIILVESEKYCFSKAFSAELSNIATEQLRATSVEVHTSSKVEEIIGEQGKVQKVKLSNGMEIDADAVIFSIGYRSNVALAEKTGLPLNKMGAIKVDAYERTPIKDVCAIGDCSQTIGFLTGRSDYVLLASSATEEARVLGYNLFGVKIKKSFYGTLGVFSTKINGMAMAAAGINEKDRDDANIEFLTAKYAGMDRHPVTIPDSSALSINLHFSPSNGIVLGGEVWGGDSAGEIINTLSLAIQKGITVYELISFQLGTHPLLTSAPTKPIIIKAAEIAIDMIDDLRK